MKALRLVLLPLLLAASYSVVRGQSPSPACSQLLTGDACQKSVDMFAFIAPQLGTVIAGGSPVLGQGNVLSFIGSGRPFPAVSVGLRVNILGGSIPDLTNVPISFTGPSNSTPIPLEDQIVLGPALDAAVGLFEGFALGPARVLGVDVLVSALYLPDFEVEGVSVHTSGSALRLGWGGRVALLQESIVTPSVSVSFLRRELPPVDILANSTSGSNSIAFSVTDLRKTTDSWRAMLSKNFIVFAIAVGAGRDEYDAAATVTATVNSTTAGPTRLEQRVSRFNYFADLTMKLGPLRLSGEVGRVQGGTIETFNVFDGARADAARLYGSLGARLGI